MDELKLLKFLSEKSIQNKKYVSGRECIDSLFVTEQEFVETVQLLEDKDYVQVLKTKSALPLVKISSNGRNFLRNGEEKDLSTNSTTYNIGNVTQVSGNVYGGISQSDNRIAITQQLEMLQSEIKMKNILEDTKKELIQKIDEIKTEHAKNTDTSREKITKIISDIARISSEWAPILSKIFGI